MPLREIIDLVEDTYGASGKGQAEVPTKIGVHPDFPGSFLHAMPAWVAARRALGMKWISYYPGNRVHGSPDASGLLVLNDPSDGVPVAILEAMWVTYARTAACAAVMAKYFAAPQPQRLGLVGCGGLARWSLLALSELFPTLREVHVASRGAASREAFAHDMTARGSWHIEPEPELRRAVEGMDIVVSSIPRPPAPVVRGAWWSEGALAIALDVIGTWDQAAFDAADRLVTDDYHGLRKRAEPSFVLPKERADIGAVVAGTHDGTGSQRERVMAIPTGVASMDVTLGWAIYERAAAKGLGRRFAFT